jgi:hypothetical protein
MDNNDLDNATSLKHEPPDPSYNLCMGWTCKNCQEEAVDNDCNITSTIDVYNSTMFKVGYVIIAMCQHCGETFRHHIETEPDDVFL